MDTVDAYFAHWKVPAAAQTLARRDIPHWIDGRPEPFGAPVTVFEPSTGQALTRTFEAGAEGVDRAVRSARGAFEGAYAALRPLDRQSLLLRLADLIETAQDELGFLESVDVGKPLAQARTIDMGGAIDVLRYFAGWATKIDGRTAPLSALDRRHFGLTLKQPVGVVAMIAPWNFPLQTLIWKCAAALAAGCTIVAKPSEITPISTLRLAELVAEAGFPPGTFNVVNGTGPVTGAALVAHPGIDKVSFTGSTATGRAVGRANVDRIAHLTLELGGKSADIVCAHRDLDQAAEGVINGIFFNAGQVCDAGSRLLVDESVYGAFMDRLVAAADKLVVGPGLDPDSFMGPLVSASQHAKVTGYIAEARTSDLRFALDRSEVRSGGWYCGPVIIEDCPVDHAVWREEVFGPVLAVRRARGPAALLELAAQSDYGLAAAIYSRDLATVLTMARRLDAGTIYVNGHGFLDPAFPFGGLGQSGLGKDLGPEQMDAYLETKAVLLSGLLLPGEVAR